MMDKPRWVFSMDQLEIDTKAELLARGKEMGLKGLSGLNKKGLIEAIKNLPPPKTLERDIRNKDCIIDELETYSRLALIAKAKEMGLRNFRGVNKKELIEIIRNPPPPKTPARYAGVKKKVILTPIHNDQPIETLVFPTIYKASKHFNINPARIHICIMERHTVDQLRKEAKKRGLHGYSRLRKAELIRLIQSSSAAASSTAVSKPQKQYRKIVFVWNHSGGSLLDAPIPAHEIPKGDILKPTPAPLIKKIEKAVDWGKKKVEDWGQWLKKEVPNTPRAVDDKLKDFKEHINKLYKTSDQPRFKIFPKKSSLKQFAKMYTIEGSERYGPLAYLEVVKPTVINFLNVQKNIKIELFLKCRMTKKHIDTGEVEEQDAYFASFQRMIFQETDREEIYDECAGEMLESLATFTREGSGWVVESVEGLDLHTVKYTPLKGSSYIKLSKHLERKMAIINMQNKDEECFKWCVTRALYPVQIHPERITKILRKQAEKLVWDGIEFPVEVKSIDRFERLNPEIGVNVYMYEDGLNPLRVSSKAQSTTKVIDLLLITEGDKKHYCLIKNLSRLVSSSLSKHEHKKFICRRCLNYLGSQRVLDTHSELCRDHEAVREKMPKEETYLSFKNHQKKMDMPFTIYADFESLIKPLDTVQPNPKECYTEKKQQHIPISFCYYVLCSFDDRYSKRVEYTAKSEDEDVAQTFVEALEAEVKDIYKNHPAKEMIFTDRDAVKFEDATCCWLCGEDFEEGKDKVRDHCHYTGKFRGAAHNSCNLKFQRPKFTPVVLHNSANYDAHLFVRNLGVSEGDIDCIPNNEEKYISFTKHVVVDKFFNKKGRKRRRGKERVEGVYPYEWMNTIQKLDEPQLPPKEAFFSALSGKGISDEDYTHAQNVWRVFGCKTFRDYHNLYNRSDVLLLADVFENFRELCKENYDLDPCWYFTAPGLAWDACLKLTGVKLELLSDINMLHMFEAGIRGGISMISTRHAKANNKYMEKSFDPIQPSKFITYLDANNLYGWAMSKSLPTGGFKWVDEKDFGKWENFPCILEVDLKGVKEELHDHFNDYPPAPENQLIEKVHKLVCTLNEKKKYIVHHETLKHYMSLGIEIGKIHRIIRFNESPWMKKYIDLNTSLRAKAKNEFEKDFYKLMNNAVFGKTMENIRKRVDVRLVTREEKAKKLANKVNFKHCTIFSEDLCTMHMRKTQILFNKPLYLGMSILDISKTLMYDFHYNYIKPKYPEGRSKLLFTDTDSLCYEIQTEDFYKDITSDVDRLFDTSNISKRHSSGIPTGVNKKVIGTFKDEASGKIIQEFVGLRAKLYSYKMFDDGEEKKKCKGIKEGVVERTISFDDYKRCLFSGVKQLRKMNTLRSLKHEMYMEEINKVALSADDDKRIILPDKIHTYAIGHCREADTTKAVTQHT
ncbi:hypothetical protein AWC38_SpisGene24958 [Stylophora pistillata]|uniref:Rho termination factor-like N-terminal domain-containing protein n=1 Tax=Stylophora pistillata TaxID=50429 RepID=A0A2B4R4R2_STYPI|nr:hypothetical protein AWC38_SpisGene24958 [Stylophora pistillata]